MERWIAHRSTRIPGLPLVVLVTSGTSAGGCDWPTIPTRTCFRPVEGRIPASDAVPADGPRGRPVPAGRGNVGVSVAGRGSSRAFFMLMACCGLRTREVRRLAVGHVDHKARSIDVVDSRPVAAAGCPWATRSPPNCWNATNGPANASRRPSCVLRHSTGNLVSRACPAWGSAASGRAGSSGQAGKRPRPYDFRHRFAFANIERWTRDGVDVMAMLPYLAAYMGHAGIDSTLCARQPRFHGRIRGPVADARTRGPETEEP